MTGKICGTGSYSPKLVWDNNKLSEMVETSDQWIRERTGVQRRHIAQAGEHTAYMAAQAAREALLDGKADAAEIDLIIVATMTSNEIMPTAACQVQKEIGAKNATCFDLNAACTGFLLAFNTAQAYISQGIYSTALVIGAESLSNLTNWEDRTTCVLFGDGAGAVLLKASEEGKFAQITCSVGEKGEVLTCTSRNQKAYTENPKAAETYMQMDGKEVFKFAVSTVPKAVKNLLEKAQMRQEEIQYYVLHQANERIVQSVSKRLGEPIEKFPMNISEYGNTSSASIPILLDEMNKKGMIKPGDNLILSGFGAGLTYGASLVRW